MTVMWIDQENVYSTPEVPEIRTFGNEHDLVDAYGAGVTAYFINIVYDTDRTEWVTWVTVSGYDDLGAVYPYNVGDWKADSYAHVGEHYGI